MRKAFKNAFRPALEPVEERIAASSGLGSVAHAAHAAAAKHHAAPKPAAHHAKAKAKAQSTITIVSGTPAAPPVISAPPAHPTPAPPTTGASTQAWVQLVNMTGQDLQYQISLGPYQGGKFLPVDIAGSGPNSVQYEMSSLITNGQVQKASFAIQFGNGAVTPLNTGISAQAAQGYYIFQDSNLNYYVAPFTHS